MKKGRNNQGLTLVEIIITLAILGVVVTPLMSMFITSQKINRESEIKYKAIQLAQKYIENIKAEDALDLTSGSYTGSSGNYSKIISDDGYDINISLDESDEVEFEEVETLAVPGTFDQIVNVAFSGTVEEITSTKNNENIRINLKIDDGKIKINNNYVGVKFYLYKLDNTYDYTISGNGTIIEVQDDMDKPDNMLFDIKVDVYKEGKLIETVNSSKIFTRIMN